MVEAYTPSRGPAEPAELDLRMRSAARELHRAGTPVRFLRTIHVPEDELCLYLIEAPGRDVVSELTAAAGLAHERIVEAAPIATEEVLEG